MRCLIAWLHFCIEARKPRPSLVHYPCSHRSSLQLYIYGLRSSLAFQGVGGGGGDGGGVFVTFQGGLCHVPSSKTDGVIFDTIGKRDGM